LAISAADSITLAIEHTKQQLFQPFRIGQWTKLAFVGLLAGELGANGCNRSNFNVPHHPTAAPHMTWPGLSSLGINPALVVFLIAAAVIAAFAIGIIMMFISSVMRFVLFDGIVSRECRIRQGWNHRLGPGSQYFVWKVLYILLTGALIIGLVGVPLAFAFSAGLFREPKEHIPALALIAAFSFLVLFAFLIATAVILVLTKDFVVPQMAVEDVGVMEGWRRLWGMMKAEKGAYAGYIGMKIVLAIVAATLIGIATLILGLIIVVPSVAFGLLAVVTGKAAGLTWTPATIALAVTIGLVLLAVFLYLVSLVAVPFIVFFPAYSIYFFAARYPQLSAMLQAARPAPSFPAGATVPL
jgi:hypothetical protein